MKREREEKLRCCIERESGASLERRWLCVGEKLGFRGGESKIDRERERERERERGEREICIFAFFLSDRLILVIFCDFILSEMVIAGKK